jgi:hypothetical protein
MSRLCRAAAIVLAFIGLVSIPATAEPVDVQAVPPMGDFPVGFWCGPPSQYVSVERFQQIRAAGFTVAFPACEGPFDVATNRRVLDAAQAAGIKAMIKDSRMPYAITGVPDATARLDAIIADYASHPALAGYDILDEPSAGSFPGLGEVVGYLKAHDPAHLAYVNLLPNYGGCCWGTSSYQDYVQRFVSQVRPELLSYDHYPFFTSGDRAEYFPNLETVRGFSLANNLPFWQIIQVTQHYSYRRPTEAEKLWQAMQTLAYGGTGVMSFTYWTPRDCSTGTCQRIAGFYDGIIDLNGNPTAQYAEIQRVNAAVRAIGRHLLTARSRLTFRNGSLAPGPTDRPAGAPVYLPSDAPVTVGIFDSTDYTYALLANRDYRNPVSTRAVFAFGSALPEWLDASTGTWRPVTSNGTVGSNVITTASFGAGAGILYRVRNPVPAGPPGPEARFGRVRSDVGYTHGVDMTYGTYPGPARGWNSCDAGYTGIGNAFHSNGFWLCARNDLTGRGFYVGNVVNDVGYYYRVQNGHSIYLGLAGWNQCAGGSTFMGQYFASNGFWTCLDRPGALGPEAVIGRVRSDVGYLHLVDSTAGVWSPGGAGWNTCPPGYTADGIAFHSNGFWLCARNDLLASHRFYVGNVVNDSGYYYSVLNGSTTYLGYAGWNQCAGTSRFLGRYFTPNGFWLCME